jgi:hypothetical protein
MLFAKQIMLGNLDELIVIDLESPQLPETAGVLFQDRIDPLAGRGLWLDCFRNTHLSVTYHCVR